MRAAASPAPVVRFDPDAHQYFLNEVRVPGITEMLARCGYIEDEWYDEESADRGHQVHQLTAQWDLGAIRDPRQVECLHKPYVLAYIKFIQDAQPQILSVELARISALHRFGGRPDRTVRLWGAAAVVEVKTGAPEDWHGYQTALQAILVAPEFALPPTAVQRYGLYLRRTGKYALLEHKGGRRDFATAAAIVRACCKKAE